MRRLVALSLAFVVVATGVSYASDLETWLEQALTQTAGPEIAESDRAGVADCLSAAMVAGISGSDQERMLKALKTRKLDRSTNDLFERYLGMSPLDGPVVPPDPTDPSTFQGGKLHYGNGRPVTPIDPAQATTISTVTAARCPDLVQRYPRAFKL
jgi:hypothetical protein